MANVMHELQRQIDLLKIQIDNVPPSEKEAIRQKIKEVRRLMNIQSIKMEFKGE